MLYILGAFLIKQLFHSRLLDMRLVIANSYPTSANGIIVNYSLQNFDIQVNCVTFVTKKGVGTF